MCHQCSQYILYVMTLYKFTHFTNIFTFIIWLMKSCIFSNLMVKHVDCKPCHYVPLLILLPSFPYSALLWCCRTLPLCSSSFLVDLSAILTFSFCSEIAGWIPSTVIIFKSGLGYEWSPLNNVGTID